MLYMDKWYLAAMLQPLQNNLDMSRYKCQGTGLAAYPAMVLLEQQQWVPLVVDQSMHWLYEITESLNHSVAQSENGWKMVEKWIFPTRTC